MILVQILYPGYYGDSHETWNPGEFDYSDDSGGFCGSGESDVILVSIANLLFLVTMVILVNLIILVHLISV